MADTENTGGMNEVADLALARAVRELDREMMPGRDLWPAIERNIVAHPQRRPVSWPGGWMPWGIAASLLIATASLVLNVMRIEPVAPRMVSFDKSMDNMQAEYVRVRNPLVEKFSETNRGLDPATLDDLYRNFDILENARREIERQVRANPQDTRLVELLMKVHEQELDLLKQDFTQPGHSM